MADPPGLLQQQPAPPDPNAGSSGLGGLLGNLFKPTDFAAAYYGPPNDPAVADMARTRALAAAAGAFGQAAMPVPFKGGVPLGAALGMAGGAAGTAADAFIHSRLEGAQSQLYGVQAQSAQQMLEMNRVMAGLYQHLGQVVGGQDGSGQGGPGTSAAGNTGPTGPAKIIAQSQGKVFDTGNPFLNLVAHYESGYRPNVATGGQDLSSTPLDPTGFPKWQGIAVKNPVTGKDDVSTAAGLFQITASNWHNYAPALIAAGKMKPDFSPESQIAVANAMLEANPDKGDWLKWNKNLAAAYSRGDTIKVPGAPGTQVASAGGSDAQPAEGAPKPLVPAPASDAPVAQPPAAAPAPGNRPPPTPGTLITSGGVPGLIANRAQGAPTDLARQLVAAGVNMPNVATTEPTFAPGVQPGGAPPAAAPPTPPAAAPKSLVPAPPAAPAAPPVPPIAQPPAAPAGGTPAAPTPPAAAPAAPPAAAPQGPPPMPPGVPGGPSQEAVRTAKAIAGISSMTGRPVPDWVNKLAGFDLIAPQAAAEAAGKLPYTPTRVGPGGGVSLGGNAPGYIVPTIQKQLMPDGSYGDFYVSPPTPQNPQGTRQYIGPSAPSARTQAGETKGGEIGAAHAPLEPATPAAPAPGQPAAPQSRGTPLATGLNSKMPDYKEPAYSDFDLQKYGDQWVARSQDMTSTIGAAQTAEQRLTTIADAFKQIQTGAYMTDKATFNAALASIFGPNAAGFFQGADPATVEKALHENYKATLQGLATVNKRFTNNEFNVTSEKSENPNLQPEANLTMLSEDIAQLRQLKALGTDWVEARINGKRDPETFQTKWLNDNPLPPIVDAVRKEIGPLKGMQPDSSSTTMPAGVPSGSVYLGTLGGKPVYNVPDGKGGFSRQMLQ